MDAIENIKAMMPGKIDNLRFNSPNLKINATSQSFEVTMSEFENRPTNSEQGITSSAEGSKALQKMFVSQLVGELFKEQTESTFGEGTQGNFYASVFADAVAEQLAERDVLGFGKMFDIKK